MKAWIRHFSEFRTCPFSRGPGRRLCSFTASLTREQLWKAGRNTSSEPTSCTARPRRGSIHKSVERGHLGRGPLKRARGPRSTENGNCCDLYWSTADEALHEKISRTACSLCTRSTGVGRCIFCKN